MKKFFLVMILCFLVLLTIGCGSQQVLKNEEVKKEKQVQEKRDEEKKYNIDKIIIPVQTEWSDDLKVYRDFNISILKEMAQLNNIAIELKELPTFDDVHTALVRGDIDVMPGIDKLGDIDLTKTYTYFTDALYLPNGEEYVPRTSYAMVVRKDDHDLLNFLNDMILEFNETGRIDEIKKEYLGDRN